MGPLILFLLTKMALAKVPHPYQEAEDFSPEDTEDAGTISEGKVVPKEKVNVGDHIFQLQLTSLQYTELEEKIPGLKNGMYKSPADGEWKKVRVVAGA